MKCDKCDKEATISIRELSSGNLEAYCEEHRPKGRFAQ
jgi:hypothetical protein